MSSLLRDALVASCVVAGAFGIATPANAQSRGELLYTTHCVTCHDTQLHWRERKLATDWAGLVTQVRRWQAEAKLGWGDDDIIDVSRYLNDRFYAFPKASASRATPVGKGPRPV